MLKLSQVAVMLELARDRQEWEYAAALVSVIENSLSPRQEDALNYVRIDHFGSGVWVTTSGLARAMGISLTHANNLLKALYDYGLLQRQRIDGRNGYEYAPYSKEN
jgi:hypothetical protein